MENRYDELCEVWEESYNPSEDFAEHENDTTQMLIFADWLEHDPNGEYCDLAEYLRILCGHMESNKCSLETAIEYEVALEELESEYIDREHFEAYADYVGIEHATIDDFQDRFQGEWASLGEYVEDWFEQTGELEKSENWLHPSNYVDWERLGNDLALSGEITVIEHTRKKHYPGIDYVGEETVFLIFSN